MSHIRVLCVENYPEYMGALKYMLETAGYEVMVATNGEQALRLYLHGRVRNIQAKRQLWGRFHQSPEPS